MAEFGILCFSWNASGLRLCETSNQVKANNDRKKGLFPKKDCVAPDFFETIRNKITSQNPVLVVFNTNDEDKSNTYFHANFLPNVMAEIGYNLLNRSVLKNVGQVASGSSFVNSVLKVNGSACRVSIYCRMDSYSEFATEEKNIKNKIVNYTKNDAGIKSGATCIYINHPEAGKFAFVAVDFPFDPNEVKVKSIDEYYIFRERAKAYNTLCMTELLRKFILSLPDKKQPDHIVLLGDFNYDIVVPGKTPLEAIEEFSKNVTLSSIQDLQKYDELTSLLRGNTSYMRNFKEGVNNKGPEFQPTWLLRPGNRSNTTDVDKDIFGGICQAGPNTIPATNSTTINSLCYGSNIIERQGFGWHTRILYGNAMGSILKLICQEYLRMDIGNIYESNSAATLSYLIIST